MHPLQWFARHLDLALAVSNWILLGIMVELELDLCLQIIQFMGQHYLLQRDLNHNHNTILLTISQTSSCSQVCSRPFQTIIRWKKKPMRMIGSMQTCRNLGIKWWGVYWTFRFFVRLTVITIIYIIQHNFFWIFSALVASRENPTWLLERFSYR